MDFEGCAMSLRDRVHDGQPKPDPATVACALGAIPLERLQQPLDLACGNEGPTVRYRYHGVPAASFNGHVDVAARLVVGDRVVQEVGDQPLHEAAIALGGRG